MPDDPDLLLRTLTAELAAAEAVVAERQRRDDARPFLLTALAAGAVTLLALTLPWVSDNPVDDNGFDLGWWLPAVTLLAGLGVAVLAVTTPPWLASDRLRSAVVGAGLLVGVSALFAATADADLDELRGAGPVAFLLAVAVTTAASAKGFAIRGGSPAVDLLQGERGLGASTVRARIAAATAPTPTRPRTWPLLVGLGGLLLAAAGLLGPWEQITGPAARAITGGGSLTWFGSELDETLALRWVVTVALFVALLTAAVPPVCRALPAVLAASGVVVVVLTLRQAVNIPASGLTAELSAGSGVWLCLAGGALAALGGAAVVARRTRLPVAAAVLVALTAAPAWTPPSARADDGSATLLFDDPSDFAARVGGPVRDAGVSTDLDNGVNVAADPGGDIYFLTTTSIDGRSRTVIQQVVGDHALPVTVVRTNFYDVTLLAVANGHAIVKTELDTINRIDLSRGVVDPERFRPGPADESGEAVLRAEPGGTGTGVLDARYLDATAGADGSLRVRVSGGDQGNRSYVVAPATVRSAAPWTLPAPVDVVGFVPRQGVVLAAGVSPSQLRVTAAGRSSLVLGAVSDRRCTLSRDPLSLPPSSALLATNATVTRDAAGNVFAAITIASDHRSLFVVTPAGELRRVRIGGEVRTVQASPDGQLFVLTSADRTRRLHRIADSAAAAADAERLPARPADCISDNRATAPTAKRTVRAGVAVAGATDDTTLLGADGRTLRRSTLGRGTTLELDVPGGPTRTLDRGTDGVTADGRGGAWWFVRRGDATPTLRHLDASGVVRTVESGTAALVRLAGTVAATQVDAADGSLYWRDRNAPGQAWQRTTLAGATTRTGFVGAQAWFGAGTAYLQRDKESRVVRQRPGGTAVPVLATVPEPSSLIASVVGTSGPATVPPVGLTADTDGRLLVWQGRWLGRVDHGRVTLLAGPADGLPDRAEARAITVSGDELIFVTGGRVRRVDVR